jgi:uncharacterized integral membrane protein
MAEDLPPQHRATGQEPQSAPGAEPGRAETGPAELRLAPRPTNAGRVWISVGIATILLILLIIFIAENSKAVTISFLGASGRLSLALALLIAAVVGAVVALLAGTARIWQLRREVRRHRQAHFLQRPQMH